MAARGRRRRRLRRALRAPALDPAPGARDPRRARRIASTSSGWSTTPEPRRETLRRRRGTSTARTRLRADDGAAHEPPRWPHGWRRRRATRSRTILHRRPARRLDDARAGDAEPAKAEARRRQATARVGRLGSAGPMNPRAPASTSRRCRHLVAWRVARGRAARLAGAAPRGRAGAAAARADAHDALPELRPRSLGAFTRLSDSGLGCPDWPGCYGHASPLGARTSIASARPQSRPARSPRQGVDRDGASLRGDRDRHADRRARGARGRAAPRPRRRRAAALGGR